MLDIIKWYLITISVYFVFYYLYFATQTSRRDRIFPSLLDLMNYIRDQKYGPGGFTDIFACISLLYGSVAVGYVIVMVLGGGK